MSLAEAGKARGLDLVALGRPDFDLTKEQDVIRAVAETKPDVVINAAAYTAVDQAENEPDAARMLNATGPGWLARESAKIGVPILHVSTDYVFDGDKKAPYVEADVPHPLCVYGASKLEGERAVAAMNPKHVILRTAWVYSPFGKNFVRTMLRLAETREDLGVVADQLGNPTYAPDIADALLDVAAQVTGPGSAYRWGVFHMTSAGEAVWADFAEAIFAHARAAGAPAARVKRITSAEFPTPVKRPANSRLDGGKLEAIYRVRLPAWQTGLEQCMARLMAAKGR